MREVSVGLLQELTDPGCREFSIGDGDWPFQGFIVRQGDEVHAYQNQCAHLGHQLNWMPDGFLTKDSNNIICASHGALYEIGSGLCVAGPCLGKSLHPVEVRVENNEIIVRGPSSLR